MIGTAHLLQSRTDEAIPWLEKPRSNFAAGPLVHIRLASAYALKGETKRASAEDRRLPAIDDRGGCARIHCLRFFARRELRGGRVKCEIGAPIADTEKDQGGAAVDQRPPWRDFSAS